MERCALLLIRLLLLACCTYGLEFRYGSISINRTTDSRLCHHVTLSSPFQQSTGVRIHLSLSHGERFTKVHNPGALWSTGITSRGFTVCLREVGPRYNDTTADVHWLAMRGSHGYLEQGETSFDEFTVGSNCKSVSLTKKYSFMPRVFLTLLGPNQDPHNSAHFIWAKTKADSSSFDICLHETAVFDGAHSGIKVVWIAFDAKQSHPWNYTDHVTFDFKAPATSIQHNNYATCKVVNFTNPFYKPPVLLMSGHHHSNKSLSLSSSAAKCSAISVWAEEVSKGSFRACMKTLPIDDSVDQSIGANYIAIGELDPCIGVTCDYYAICKARGPHDAHCVCVTDCEKYEESVCSSNGTTYRNKCYFQLAMCRTKDNHTLAHPGSCRGFPWQRGSALINSSSTDQDTACTTQSFVRYTFYLDKQIHIQLTVNHADTNDFDYVHDAMASWVEDIDIKGFKVCVATAGHRNRRRTAMASVDWFAYQGVPAGGVADRTKMSEWWTGTKCTTIRLPRGKFRARPTVLVTAEHLSMGARHDAANIWTEEITTTSFKICLRELQNFDGLHQDIYVNWMAFDEIHRPLFTEKGKVYFPNKGQPSVEFNGAFCKDLEYKKAYGHVPTILLSTSHESSVGGASPACNAVSTWVEYKNNTGFRICLKELYVNKYEPLTVSYLLLFDICSHGWQYFQGICYHTSHTCQKWTAAENVCRTGAAHLVTVRNQEENVYLQQKINGEKSWIGLNDRSIEGDFRWSSKMRVNWTYWAPNQPNDYDSIQDCVHTLGQLYHYRWNDVDCNTCNNYTCAKDYDECSTGNHGCHGHASCSNTYGSYTCQCHAGFTGNGRNCTDINECASSPCSTGAKCNNTIGSYACACKVGYSGNGVSCSDVDECATNSHSCHVNAACTNTKGSYNCTCKRGYHGNGRTCVFGRGFHQSNILSSNMNYINTLNSYLSGVIQSSSRSLWDRCWRASTDGWASLTFHARCDNKGSTVTIVRVGSYVFGGYTDQTWASCSCYRTSYRSFLFSLYNPYGYSPRKITLMRWRHYAVYCYYNDGPTFGGGHDLCIYNYASSNRNSYQNRGHTYYNPGFYFAGSRNFIPNDVEVFYETT